MNVSCPDCRSIFRVDPAKVPPAGVRARCSVCSGVITIPAPTGQTTPTGGNVRSATPTASIERPRATPPAQGNWDTPPYGGPARQTPAAPPIQRPAPAPPPAPPRASEIPAPRPTREESLNRGPVTATVTPPSPTSGLPEFCRVGSTATPCDLHDRTISSAVRTFRSSSPTRTTTSASDATRSIARNRRRRGTSPAQPVSLQGSGPARETTGAGSCLRHRHLSSGKACRGAS